MLAIGSDNVIAYAIYSSAVGMKLGKYTENDRFEPRLDTYVSSHITLDWCFLQ